MRLWVSKDDLREETREGREEGKRGNWRTDASFVLLIWLHILV
jgi:hypothetical protein